MRQFLVTIKLSKNPDHDPQRKMVGSCPANPGAVCTDVTGEHHTILWEGESIVAAGYYWRGQGMHVTRIEEV